MPSWMKRVLLGALVLLVVALVLVRIAADQSARSNALEEAGFERLDAPLEDGRRVSYFEAGAPEQGRIVYVHGSPGSSDAWESYLQEPVAGAQSVALDRLGYGGSHAGEEESELRAQASAIEPFLGDPEAGVAPPVLVGHSLGGPIVARAAVDHPGRVAGLVIVAGSLDPGLEERRWFNEAADLWPIRALIPTDLRVSNDEMRPLKSELEAMAPALAEVDAPVLIVHARNDMLVPFGNVAFMESAFPAEQLRETVVLEEENHFLPWNAEDQVRAAIRSLLPPSPES